MADVLADLESFRGGFAGRVVTRDDADYDAVRAECVWNGDVDRRPWVIARADLGGRRGCRGAVRPGRRPGGGRARRWP